MKLGTIVMKLGAVFAPLVVMLVLGAPPASAAGITLVVAPALHPTDCGSYTTANYQDLSIALASATTGTVVVCPGTYPAMSQDAVITNASKLTVKRALTTDGSRPVIPVRSAAAIGLLVESSSNVTIDGLIVDGTNATNVDYAGIEFSDASGAVRNSTVIGPTLGASAIGIAVGTSTTATTTRPLTVTGTNIFGFGGAGIEALGHIKLTISSDVIDSTDGGRVAAPNSVGISLIGGALTGAVTGSVSKCTIVSSNTGISLSSVSSATVSGNIIHNASKGIYLTLSAGFPMSANNNKFIGNTITGVGADNAGIYIEYTASSGVTMQNTLVSANTIVAATYNATAYGVRFTATAPANAQFTAKVTKNTLIGFPSGDAILYPIFATVTLSGNNATP